jgi:hypothetical protein
MESLNQFFGDDAVHRVFTHVYTPEEVLLATNTLAILFDVCLLEQPVDILMVRPSKAALACAA